MNWNVCLSQVALDKILALNFLSNITTFVQIRF